MPIFQQGMSQQTPAVINTLRKAAGTARRVVRAAKRVRSAVSGGRKSSRKRRGATSKLKFGSPAWQRKYKVGKFAKKK